MPFQNSALERVCGMAERMKAEKGVVSLVCGRTGKSKGKKKDVPNLVNEIYIYIYY
jgi:hypothetical protein